MISAQALDRCAPPPERWGRFLKSEAETRQFLQQLQEELAKYPQIELPVKHVFTSGIYAREVLLPKGSIVVGKIHRHDHLNFISRGEVTVLTKEGVERLRGPCTMVSSAGTKRAVYAHEDTVWMTIHANPKEERDLAKIEAFVIAPNFDEFPLQVREHLIEERAI